MKSRTSYWTLVFNVGPNLGECMPRNALTRNAKVRKQLSSVQTRIHQAALRLFAERGVESVHVKDLARRAKVARGTIYNNRRASMEEMFQEIAGQSSAEMHQRITATLVGIEDPAVRLAMGMRFFVRRAYQERDWGAFIVRFAMSNSALREMWFGPPRKDFAAGIDSGRYKLRPEQVPAAIVMIATTTLGAMFLVLKSQRNWKRASSDAVELTLRAFGVSPREALKIATTELPELAALS